MKKLVYSLLFFLFTGLSFTFSQDSADVEVYLITCSPGIATYSIYGHSALRIVIPSKSSDLVYNWGVFDFSTPNFVWKFAKGRLDYMLGVYPYKRFLEEYFMEGRSVYLQKINLETDEIDRLFSLISENLKPENVKYRYDFFYDDCSTRIRDLLEKSIGAKLLYPPAETKKLPTFREKVGEYQKHYPWLKLGVDLIMGSPGDKKASLRDKMFLPYDLQNGLSEVVVNRNGKMIPLLQNPVTALDFPSPILKQNFLATPAFILTLLLILIIILTALSKRKTLNDVIDIVAFSIFSLLALMMIFFNFFTDHQQMKWNLNIIWLNPFLLFCLLSLILKKSWHIWFRFTFFLALIYLPLFFLLPRTINNAFLPVVLIVIIRSSVRADFSWNPLSLK